MIVAIVIACLGCFVAGVGVGIFGGLWIASAIVAADDAVDGQG